MSEKKLIIVESPTKARTIKKFLPSGCTVLASQGHIREIPADELGVDIENGYTPKYVISKGKKQIVTKLKSELKNSSELILATDEDREGESISWHLIEVLNPKIPSRRMVFHEITKNAILEAFNNGRELDQKLVNAQESRRVLDRLFGYAVSPVLWKKLSNKKLSAGRVQSPGLRLIVEKERIRKQFVSSIYYDAKASFKEGFDAKLNSWKGKKLAGSKNFDSETGKYLKKDNTILLDENEAEKIVSLLKSGEYKITSIKEKEVYQNPAVPFITSTLQQEGNRKLGMSATETMKVAQSLYENGFITYMRTDSPNLSKDGANAARKTVSELYGDEYLSPSVRRFSSNSKLAQEAHEAIRPAGEIFVKPDESGLAGKEKRLYDLIWKRTLACQMARAIKSSTTVDIECGDANFTASGMQIKFPGFIRVYVEGQDDAELALDNKEKLLPSLTEGQILNLDNLESTSHETKAPARYTQASLVKTLENLGIGRPSTYATIIDRIMKKNYVFSEKNSLIPTYLGFAVVQFLENHFDNLIDYNFTRSMESGLDKIASGEQDKQEFLAKFWEGEDGLSALVAKVQKQKPDPKDKIVSVPGLGETPVFIGPYGPYVKSSDGSYISLPENMTNPGDTSAEDLKKLAVSGKQMNEPEEIGKDPKTGELIFLCNGKFGLYWQIGEADAKAKTKPPRFSVPKNTDPSDYSLETILKFLSFPYHLTPEILVGAGRFGFYVKRGNDYANVKTYQELFDLTEEKANALLDKKQKTTGPIVDFGEFEGEPLFITSGRYGYYLKHGKKNIKLPNGCKSDVDECKKLTPDQVHEMAKAAPETKSKKSSASGPVVKDLGEKDGKKLFVTSGRFGYYMKWGKSNVALPKEYKKNQELCEALTKEEAEKFL